MSTTQAPENETETVTIHISGVPDALKKRIERLAKAERRSMSAFIVTHMEKRAGELEAERHPQETAA
jgi:predicted transcriptional regulator